MTGATTAKTGPQAGAIDGALGDTWWWTEVPLDVCAKSEGLTEEDRTIWVDFKCRDGGGNEATTTVAIEWKLTEVGEGDHLIQQGEKMIISGPQDTCTIGGQGSDSVYVQVYSAHDDELIVYEPYDAAHPDEANAVYTFEDEGPDQIFHAGFACQDVKTGEPIPDTHATTAVHVIKKLKIQLVAEWYGESLPSTAADWLGVMSLAFLHKVGWSWTVPYGTRRVLLYVPTSSNYSSWAKYSLRRGTKAAPPWWWALFSHRQLLWWSRGVNVGWNPLYVRVTHDGCTLVHECEGVHEEDQYQKGDRLYRGYVEDARGKNEMSGNLPLASIFLKRVTDPVEAMFAVRHGEEHCEVGGKFKFSMPGYTPPIGAHIRYDVRRCSIWGDTPFAEGRGRDFEIPWEDKHKGDVYVTFYMDANKNLRLDASDPATETIVRVEECRVFPFSVGFSSKLGAGVNARDVEECFSDAQDLLLKRDTADDWRACVKFVVTKATKFVPDADAPDPARTKEEHKKHYEKWDVTILGELSTGASPLAGITYGLHRTLVCWGNGPNPSTIAHEIGHKVGWLGRFGLGDIGSARNPQPQFFNHVMYWRCEVPAGEQKILSQEEAQRYQD